MNKYDDKMPKKSSGGPLPKEGYEKKVDMPRAQCAPYSRNNAEEYKKDIQGLDSYVKNHKANQ